MALRTKDLQNLDFIFATCHTLPDYLGLYEETEDGDENPDYYALLEKECGALPEGVDKDESLIYYEQRYKEYTGGRE